eukprot:325117-Rhodomonas_salina.1
MATWSRPLPAYAPPTPSPVLTQWTRVPAYALPVRCPSSAYCDALSGTAIAHNPTSLRACYALSGSDLRAAWYQVSGGREGRFAGEFRQHVDSDYLSGHGVCVRAAALDGPASPGCHAQRRYQLPGTTLGLVLFNGTHGPVAPYTLVPVTFHPTPYTLHPTPHALFPFLFPLHPEPETPDPRPYTMNPESYTLDPTSCTLLHHPEL